MSFTHSELKESSYCTYFGCFLGLLLTNVLLFYFQDNIFIYLSFVLSAIKPGRARLLKLFCVSGQGSGPGGRIRAQDLSKSPAPVTAPTVDSTKPTSLTAEGEFLDIPLSNIRKVIASVEVLSSWKVLSNKLRSNIDRFI